jgi:tryptophan 7-halogenase
MSDAIRSVVIAGSGPVAWVAAAGLKRALRNRALEVSVVDTGAANTPVGYWTLPSQRGIHRLLGIVETQFIQQTGATFRLASELRGWQGAGSSFLHAHADIGIELGGTPFYRYLQAESVAGRAAKAEAFSVAGVAARLGRFARPMGKDLTASFNYGFHVPAEAYTRLLRATAENLGARALTSPLAEVLPGEGGNIAGLHLQDGTVVAGDLFVDCSGPEARLLGTVSDNARDDWSGWLPVDRMLSAVGPALRDPAPVTQIEANHTGWQWRAPLLNGSMAGLAYGSAFMSDEAARASFQKLEPAAGEAVLTRFSPGRRRQSWVRNCVALGDAVMELEPLCGAGLHFAQVGLAMLVELFPLNRSSAIEAVEYNRLMAEQADSLRDFTLAHYRAGRPLPGELWAAARSQALPARLAHKLDLYAASGRINLLDHEAFEEVDWAWLLIGSGLVPAAVELQIRDVLMKLTPQDVEGIRARVQQLASSMPPHIEFVRHQAQAAASANREVQ